MYDLHWFVEKTMSTQINSTCRESILLASSENSGTPLDGKSNHYHHDDEYNTSQNKMKFSKSNVNNNDNSVSVVETQSTTTGSCSDDNTNINNIQTSIQDNNNVSKNRMIVATKQQQTSILLNDDDVWFDLPNENTIKMFDNSTSAPTDIDNYESCLDDNDTTNTNSYDEDDDDENNERFILKSSGENMSNGNDKDESNSRNRTLQVPSNEMVNILKSSTTEENDDLTSLIKEQQRSLSTNDVLINNGCSIASGNDISNEKKKKIKQLTALEQKHQKNHQRRSSYNSSLDNGSVVSRKRSSKSKHQLNFDSLDPLVSTTGNTSSTPTSSNNNVLRSVQKVGQHAAKTTKHAVWDTNELSITAALNAVDQWETLYHTIRQLVVLALTNTTNFYDSVKVSLSSSNSTTENDNMYISFVRCIRDWIAIPTIHGMEQLILTSISFIQSSQAQTIANQSMNMIQHIPYIGSTILVPCIGTTGSILHNIWNVVQYPIPSKSTVRNNVDKVMTSMKWIIRTCWTEVVYYIQRADANITRTLSHTQWKVLGSGPYETLPDDSKVLVINHMCERYYSLANNITSRYELAAHVKRHNPLLFIDLVSTGIWKERGGSITVNDEWLHFNPTYRIRQKYPVHPNDDTHIDNTIVEPYLLSPLSCRTLEHGNQIDYGKCTNDKEENTRTGNWVYSPLWFRLPNINGERPPGDAPWIPFSIYDQHTLEEKYLNVLRNTTTIDVQSELDGSHKITSAQTEEQQQQQHQPKRHSKPTHKTIAQWYENSSLVSTTGNSMQSSKTSVVDVLVDQKRHSVTLQLDRSEYHRHGYASDIKNSSNNNATIDSMKDIRNWNFIPPKPNAVCRPNFWRFYGPGDNVRRAVWVIDIPGKGLQPFDEDAHSILEDAFLFLQWIQDNRRRTKLPHQKENQNTPIDEETQGISDKNSEDIRQQPEKATSYDGDLLTVEVNCPDGATRLVQFSSRTRVTAIQQGLYASMSLFKLRVYRGVWLQSKADLVNMANQSNRTISSSHDKFLDVVEEHGLLGDTIVPNMSLRELLLDPKGSGDESIHNITSLSGDEHGNDDEDDTDGEYCLAAPRDRVEEEDLANYLYDITSGNETRVDASDEVDHLVLVVHGIGEMLRSADFMFGLAMPSLSSIVDCCSFMRKNHAEIQKQNMLHDPSAFVDAATTSVESSNCGNKTSNNGRVEYLPVEWHEAFAILSQRRVAPPPNPNKPYVMINDISLKTIPNMRNFANDTLMDVLYFMSPEHHDTIVEVVVNEMNFCKSNQHFGVKAPFPFCNLYSIFPF
jgi:hypothetical protein